MTDIFAYPGEVNPNDVKAHDPTLLYFPYFGILKRWTGAAWVKAKLMVYEGGVWVAKSLKLWDGIQWEDIDTTGV
jgi:hypothetical protein